MSLKVTILALLLTSLTTSLPMHQNPQNITDTLPSWVTPDVSTHALTKRTTSNPAFDPWSFNKNEHRTDGSPEGDVLRVSHCFCIDTPSKDLPPAYGQFHGSYYGFDYYNYHLNQSYPFSRTCASGEMSTVTKNTSPLANDHELYEIPKCLAWMQESYKQCWQTDDGNQFCVEAKHGKDFYYWNGQKRGIRNHPPAAGTLTTASPELDGQCQRMCQTVPALTLGVMQDTLVSNHSSKITLAESTVCTEGNLRPQWYGTCDPGDDIKKFWEAWNYIETYSDQADMCKHCA